MSTSECCRFERAKCLQNTETSQPFKNLGALAGSSDAMRRVKAACKRDFIRALAVMPIQLAVCQRTQVTASLHSLSLTCLPVEAKTKPLSPHQ
jgi:hypothetical protein